MADTNFKLGDEVTWKSQARGRQTQKAGKVVYVHQNVGYETAIGTASNLFPGHKRMFDGLLFARGAVLVEVLPEKGSRAKPRLYMPKLSGLSKIASTVT